MRPRIPEGSRSEAEVITIQVQTDPVAWSRPRFNSRTRAVFNSKGLKNYQSMLRSIFQKKLNAGEVWKARGALSIALTFFIRPPKRKVRDFPSVKPDLDNFVKGVCDAANEILWDDDAQVCEISAAKIYSETPGFILAVKELKEGGA